MFGDIFGQKKKGRVFVGLSGGVDSAVSAALLQEQGYEVTGVFIHIAIDGYPCTAGVDRLDAMRVAAHLRVSFREIDLSEEYRKKVFLLSIKEFKKGRTPNPDALCNREIKFGLFFDYCIVQGADYVATGHYARVVRPDPALPAVELHAGADEDKDQSYFLWAVDERKLRKTLFPLGDIKKTEVRALAKKLRLPNAERKDSQGLCFLGPISMSDMLRRELPLVPGDVLDESGAVMGRHEGALAYTLGQRHGFYLSLQGTSQEPHYVVAKDSEFNTITVSTKRTPNTSSTSIFLADTNWIGPLKEGPCMARYRYRQKLIPAELRESPTSSTVTLLEPHYVPQGQSLVLYRGSRCIGGGSVESVDN
ncbi:tRNA 2-thiouridine(34) synthase MnmA [Candidatus Adlerbacteria bacterium RIFCSPHIGHO2_02_FULL_54_18]|uniref:tRNA-specific 2-thiouridylase MnmA n=2 Tax=Candidatus Adleribacteriota TaxID=1752736 RepID=A0A1F4Y1J7_9BACT|nr:MAG: tRNA 2-thiouridine(34) synthase MnmA [Candidatus Adlerbacteria bacterium RIFCSPLOWO2_01_FULL_54_21b]OGC87850.1 MAG: tRNA 2-thiouridine(34) synthase MnmA [Candidatus Adlerbacteria bacterium RIFCSPHIGHO2_02_FULL_54_18]